MQITNFTVRFGRTVQPAKYEEAEAMIEFAGIIDDGENPAQMTANALALAKRQVLASLGKGSASSQLGSPTVAETSAVDVAEPVEAEVVIPAKKGRGRPKTKETKAKEAAKAMADEAQDEAVAELEKAAGVAVEIPEESEIDDKTLQDAANAAAKKYTGKVVKVIMVETFGVQMLRDITVGDRPKFLAALAALDKN